jgi:hypothetical protein
MCALHRKSTFKSPPMILSASEKESIIQSIYVSCSARLYRLIMIYIYFVMGALRFKLSSINSGSYNRLALWALIADSWRQFAASLSWLSRSSAHSSTSANFRHFMRMSFGIVVTCSADWLTDWVIRRVAWLCLRRHVDGLKIGVGAQSLLDVLTWRTKLIDNCHPKTIKKFQFKLPATANSESEYIGELWNWGITVQ